jgi:Ca2+-binding RTX toxin-like protein
MTDLSTLVVTGYAWTSLNPSIFSSLMAATQHPITSMDALIASGRQQLASSDQNREMGGVIAPETPYVVPPYTPNGQPVTAAFLNGVIQHIKDTPYPQKVAEWYDMFTNKDNPYFIDFDQYPGSTDVSYFSKAEGAYVTDSIYASFGNYAYGAIGRLADLPPELLKIGADWTQHGQAGISFYQRHDDPHDAINVDAGIASAQNYIQHNFDPSHFFQVSPAASAVGTANPDAIQGTSGVDNLHGSLGDDRLDGGDGSDNLYGDEGVDLMFGGLGADNVVGGDGDDGISGGVGSDLVLGGNGADVLYGDDGNDWVDGGPGDDVVHGGPGNDRFAEASGGLWGADGSDAISGDDGDDQAEGEAGNDTLSGGAGNDLLIGDSAQVTWNMNGGGGWTVTVGTQSLTGADLLQGDDGADTIYGGALADTLYGNTGSDQMNGGSGNDVLRGGQDNDNLAGGQNDDQLFGDQGNDALAGDLGNDTESGGAGADVFLAGAGLGQDRLIDFNRSEGDAIHVVAGSYSVYQSGADTVVDFGGGSATTLVGVQMTTLSPGWIA